MQREGNMIDKERSPEKIVFSKGDVLFSDLDRTLIHTDKISGYAYRMLASQQPHMNGVIEETMGEEPLHRGKAYEYLRILQERGVEIDPVQLARDIVADHTVNSVIDPEFVASILNEGALELLKKVHELGAKNVLVTAGDELTQLFKITLVSEIVEKAEVKIDGWIMMAEGSTAKAAIVDTMFDEPSGQFKFDRDKLLELRGGGDNALIHDCFFDPQLLTAEHTRVTIFDDKLKHLLLPPGARVGQVQDDITRTPIVETSSGRMRLIHAVATGMPGDEQPRLAPAELLELVQAA